MTKKKNDVGAAKIEKKRANPLVAAVLAIVIIAVLFGVPIWWQLNSVPANPLPTLVTMPIFVSMTVEESVRASDTAIPLPTDTAIPLPTNTPDPVAALREIADGVVIGEIVEVIENMGAVVIRYEMGAGFSGYDVGFAEDEMAHLACVLRDAGYLDKNYQFHALVGFRDNFGNVSLGDGLVVRLMPDAILAINCENYVLVNLQAIAQYYELAEGLR